LQKRLRPLHLPNIVPSFTQRISPFRRQQRLLVFLDELGADLGEGLDASGDVGGEDGEGVCGGLEGARAEGEGVGEGFVAGESLGEGGEGGLEVKGGLLRVGAEFFRVLAQGDAFFGAFF